MNAPEDPNIKNSMPVAPAGEEWAAPQPTVWSSDQTDPATWQVSAPGNESIHETEDEEQNGRRPVLALAAGMVLVAAAVSYSAMSLRPHGVHSRRGQAAAKRRALKSEDAEFYKGSAEDSLALIGYDKDPQTGVFARDPQTVYDPLVRFDDAHRTRRLGVTKPVNLAGRQRPKPTAVSRPAARTTLQEMAAHRNNNRASRLNIREARMDALSELYSDHDLTQGKRALKRELKAERLTGGQKKAIIKAGAEVRRLTKRSGYDARGLEHSARGDDMPGRYHNK